MCNHIISYFYSYINKFSTSCIVLIKIEYIVIFVYVVHAGATCIIWYV